MHLKKLLPIIAAALALPAGSPDASACPKASAGAQIQPEAAALLAPATQRIGEAQTIRLVAKHRIDPALGVGAATERGPIEITVKRPNQFHAIQTAGEETREIAYDGKLLCIMYPGRKLHALEPLEARSIGQFADRVDEQFGFRPPLAELLAKDLSAQLFANVTSAKVAGTEWVGLTRCTKLLLEQEGMTGEVWIASNDQLPRRMRLTFTGMSGRPQWDIRLSKWEFDVPVDPSLFVRRPGPDSQRTALLKSR